MGLFDAAASLFNTAIESFAARGQQKREQKYNAVQAQINRDFQRDERLAAQEFNLDMWNRTNEYNSLASQIERAKEAGVSPAAIIGDGSNSGFASTFQTTPSQGTATAPTPSIASSMVGLPMQADLINAQVQNLKEDTKGKSNQNDFFTASYDERLKALQLTNDNLSKEGQSIQANIDHITKETSLLDKYYDLTARSTESQIDERRQNILNLQNGYRLISKQMDEIDANIEYTEAQTEGQQKENDFLQLKLDLSNTLGFPTGTPEFEQAWSLLKQNKLYELDHLLLQKAKLALSTGDLSSAVTAGTLNHSLVKQNEERDKKNLKDSLAHRAYEGLLRLSEEYDSLDKRYTESLLDRIRTHRNPH